MQNHHRNPQGFMVKKKHKQNTGWNDEVKKFSFMMNMGQKKPKD